ncbi:MAG: MFS transporter [Anaerolineales bacterium]|uniref:MFS transporter n=1 Tax=Candidatus Villigracilis proximus TaxID=3140683 RepID=UPI00313725C4|nr:MFS transporter [Anaerolineales bacterium]
MRIRFQLITFMFLRTILNTAHRMVYPFLPIFARGLGVDISTMSLLMTGRSLLGAASPLFAPIADRRGRKFGMLLGISIFTIGVGLVALHPSIFTLAAALILAMLGKVYIRPIHASLFRRPYSVRTARHSTGSH